MKRRILSIITALALCLSLCPTWALAAEADPSLCEHHPEHTEDCGYTAPTEGHDCGHEHTAECYTLGVLPDADSGDPYEIGGDTENLLDCQHSHNSECGYVEADPGAPCGYECRICPIEDLIAALPEQVTEDNRADVEAQLQEILGLFSDLTEEEQEEINLSRIYALQGALDEANNPMPLAGAVEYVDAAGNAQQSPADCVTITADMANKNLTGGWYVAEGNVTINGALNFNGETHLILADGCTLTVNNNLQTTNLTIYGQTNGTGFLCAGNNSLRAPAIGALSSNVAITINGGCVQAMSFTIVVGTAPYYVIGGLDGSTVTINGGIVAAKDSYNTGRTFPQNCTANSSRGCIVARDGVGEVYGSMTLAETSGSGITLSSLHISKGASLNSPGRWKSISITMEDLPTDDQFNITLKDGINAASTEEEIRNAIQVQSPYKEIGHTGAFTITGLSDENVTQITKSEDGTCIVTFTKNGKVVTRNFKLEKLKIDSSSVSLPWDSSYAYTGSAIEPEFTVTVEKKVLTKGTDYTVEYANNINIGNATLTVTGIGNYEGTVEKTFRITDSDALIEVQYVDESGQRQTAQAKAISTMLNTTQLTLEEGWYFVQGAAARFTITVPAGTTSYLILPDGSSLYAGSLNLSGSLTIYGQSGNRGKLDAGPSMNSTLVPIQLNNAGTLTVNGGNLSVTKSIGGDLAIKLSKNCIFTYNSESGLFRVNGSFNNNNGTLQTERLTEDMIAVDTERLPVGTDEDLSETVKGCVSLENPTYAGKEFILTGWTQSSVTRQDNCTYIVTYSHETRGTVSKTVSLGQPCDHLSQGYISNNDGTHTKTCLDCGKTWDAEGCAYVFSGADGTCAACGDSVTVAVSGTENLIYDGTEKKPGVTVTRAGTELATSNYTVAYTDNTNAGTAKVTVTIGNNQGTYNGSFTIGKATPTITWDTTAQELPYTGNPAAITAPAVKLVNNENFGGTISYSYATQGGTEYKDGLPTNAGTYTIKASIAAQGNYTAADSTNTLTLTINPTPVTLTFANQTIAYGDTPTGATADPASAKIEYSYTTEAGGTPISGWPTNAGTYTVTAKVKATGNYGEAIQTATLTINPKAVSNPTIELSPSSFDYDGTAKKPAVTVKDGTTVIPASEYTVAYSNNINAGTATVTITDKTGGNYTVSGTTTFTITAKPLTGAKVEATGTFTYTGNAQEPAPTVTLGGQPLTANTDYTVTYDDNTNAGTAKITVTGTGNYSGTAQGTFTIGRADLTADGTGIASGTYGDKLSGLTVSGLTAKLGEATVTGTWKLTGDTVPNVGDSGQYTATFTPATGAGNYNALTAQVTLSIAKANYTGTTTASTSAKFGTTGTYDLSALLPDGATAGTAATTSDIFEGTPTVSGKALTYQLKAGATVGNTGPITVPVISTNYQEFNLTITVTVTDKFVPTLTVSPITVTYSGEAIPGTAIKGTAKVGSTTVPGTWAFASGEAVTNVADSGTKTVKFVPTDKATYAEATAVVVVTIGKATPTGAPKYTAISASGKTLADAGLTTEGGTFSTTGTVAWALGTDTAVTANTQYEWTFTPTDAANYNTLTGKITLWVQSTGGGSYVPSGPGSSSLPVTTTGQGSTTTTTTTTAAPTATTQGGTATTTINTTMGQEIVKQAVANKSEEVVIAPKVTGSVTKAEVSIPASTVGQIGSQTSASLTVSTPVADVTIPNGGLGSLGSAGGTVTVTAEQVGNQVELTVTAGGQTVQTVPGGVTLTVPASNTTPGTVAVLVRPDGTRQVVRKSVADGDSVTIPLDGSAKLEIVDNSGYFADVPATSWAADAVAFASGHELFSGTAPGQFSPNTPMSRGMLAVVLHNLESNPAQALTGAFIDVDNSQWYAEGVAWAEAQGIIGGYGNGQFGPNDNITREQLAVMLWRYAGSPAATDRELHFADAHRASDWALEALRWATENGIINGKGGGILDPTGQATRAETAQMLKNFMESK